MISKDLRSYNFFLILKIFEFKIVYKVAYVKEIFFETF